MSTILNLPRSIVSTTMANVSGIAARKSTMPILECVRLQTAADGQALRMDATDLELHVSAGDTLDGAPDHNLAINAAKLGQLLKTLPADAAIRITGGKDAGRVTLASGRSKFTLQTLPAEDMPDYPLQAITSAVTVTEGALKRALQTVTFAMAVHDIRYYLNGLAVQAGPDGLSLIATDGHRMAITTLQMEPGTPDADVILPARAVGEIKKHLTDADDTLTLQLSPTQARLHIAGCHIATKLVEGKYPDWRRVVPQNLPNRVTLGRAELLAALQRVAVFTSDKFQGVRLTFDSGTLTITSANAESESASDVLDTDYTGDPVEIGVNVRYLTDGLQAVPDAEISISFGCNGNTSMQFGIASDPAWRYVVMPMRI